MTLHDKYCRGLEARGYERLETTSTKYTVYGRAGHADRFYVGQSGAVRVGRTIATSIPYFHKAKLLEDPNAINLASIGL